MLTDRIIGYTLTLTLINQETDTMKELRFYIKNVYGKEMTYPVKEFAKEFEALTGNKTASPTHLKALKALGFDIAINSADFTLTYL